MQDRHHDSKRIKKFRKQIIDEIPKSPNNKETRSTLEGLHLGDLLLHYLNWKSRIIPSRKRGFHRLPSLTNDPRWKQLKENIKNIEDKACRGEDLSPHLSLSVFEDGYVCPCKNELEGKLEDDHVICKNIPQNKTRKKDQDQLLNQIGLYHFHLGQKINENNKTPSGLACRTDDLLFAFVDRKKIYALAIANHQAFNFRIKNDSMSEERKKLKNIYHDFVSFFYNPEDTIMHGPGVVSTGHTVSVRRLADMYASIIEQQDVLFEKNDWRELIFKEKGSKIKSKDHLSWTINGMDLCIYDRRQDLLYQLWKVAI